MSPLYTVLLCCSLAAPLTQGKKITVSSILVTPFLMQDGGTPANGSQVPVYKGYIWDLLEHIFKQMNREFSLKVYSNISYGHVTSNGTWEGLIGDVVNKISDLAVGPLTETSRRREVVEFSTPFMNFGPVIILQKPETKIMSLEERLQRLFLPLSQSVWMMSGIAWLVTSIVLYIICHADPYDWRHLMKDKLATLREGESFTCSNAFWFTTSTLFWQGYVRSPRSLAGRVVVTFWWFYVIIFVVLYISSMTNYLRESSMPGVKENHLDIQDLENLAKHADIDVGVIKGGTTEQYLKDSKIPNIHQVWSKIQRESTYVRSLEDGIQRVRKAKKRNFALVAESAMATYFTKQSPCDIYMVADFTTMGSYSIVLPFGSGLRKDMNRALLELRETGVLKQLEDRWFAGECTDYVMEVNRNDKIHIAPFHTVDLGTFSGALIILGVGLALGSLVLVLEILIFKFAEKAEEHDLPLKANISEGGILSTEPEPITDV
ncbi:glutamate receptor 3-like [Physella acuta]|uniref:glutamate receptor 3-like n=1 Tax=Physella acuta TaxID=109671 RepID=UPI0027DACA07|nr:glutamate receptor 3-like [Physella acuta]